MVGYVIVVGIGEIGYEVCYVLWSLCLIEGDGVDEFVEGCVDFCVGEFGEVCVDFGLYVGVDDVGVIGVDCDVIIGEFFGGYLG